MSFNEAVAVYLYLQHVPPGKRDEAMFKRAWGVICSYAEPAIQQESKTFGNKPGDARDEQTAFGSYTIQGTQGRAS